MKPYAHKSPLFAYRRDVSKPGWVWLGRCASWLGHGGWVHLSLPWFRQQVSRYLSRHLAA